VRNPQTLTVHNQSFADALDRYIDQVAQTEFAAEAFRQVCDRFDARGVETLTPASATKEFLLGDVPAITVAATGAFGLSQGVTIDEADKIVMPLAPRLLVAIGPPDASRTISDDEVDLYNQMQVREAREYVVYRPGANLAPVVAAWRPPSAPPQP
jgi:hypothetical protein